MARKTTKKEAAPAVSAVKVETAKVEEKAAEVAAAPVEAPKKEEKKPVVKKAVQPAEKKEAAKKAPKKETAPKKVADKKEKPAGDTIQIQFGEDSNYSPAEIIEKCKEAYKNGGRKRISSFDVFVNVAERKAYYVANGKPEGAYIDL
ncbi:MAG: hypothetical protein IJ080_02870 [Oscillospiraceae bacterium]|nr:hypothetical protein [Oscillospiraceae bacterium]MBQ8978686.1 hypothetical protein [Oscillospiraceae bacterium]